MKIYHLKRTQRLNLTLQEAWSFLSTPKSLAEITPANLDMKILYQSGGEKMYAGQIIRYRIKMLPVIAMHWVTEITHVSEPVYFVDEQRFGPYAFWHHQHYLKEVPGGVEMTDEVNYALPLGWIGRLAHRLFVGRQLNAIFDFRQQALDNHFNKRKNDLRKLA